MKQSRYNYIIFRNDKSYWYNGVTHSSFSLSESLGRKVKDLLETPSVLKESSEILYGKLHDGGFIVEKDVDELARVLKCNEATVNDSTVYLTILPTLNCNYRCWYCLQEHVAGTKMSEDVIAKIKKLIDNKVQQGIKHLNIEWFGGEPFMYFDVIESICSHAHKVCALNEVAFSNTATTNAYFLIADKIDLLNKYNFTRFQITLDGHRDCHDKVKFQNGLDSAFDRALVNINQMLAKMPQLHILLRVNYTRDNLDMRLVDQVCTLINSEYRDRVTVTPKKVWQLEADETFQDSTAAIWKKFKESGFHVLNSGIVRDFVPCYTCRSNFLTVNYNGHLLKCTANNDLYSKEPKGVINEDGSMSWNPEYNKKFTLKSFDNERCMQCKHLPLCMGVCPQVHNLGNEKCKKSAMDLSFEDSIVNEIELYNW